MYALVAAGLQWAISRPHAHDGEPGRRVTPASTLAALPVLGAAGALGVTAIAGFTRAGTTVDPLDVDGVTRLVESGPNRFTRNPMYLALAGGLVAHAVARRSWAALLPVAAFVVLLDRTQVPVEEAALRARFGADYDDYVRRVPRWIGPGGGEKGAG